MSAQAQRGRTTLLLTPVLLGAAVAVALGVYGNLHHPTGVAVDIAGFSSTQSVKAWLATVAVFFAVVQLVSALLLYGRLGARVPAWTAPVHRWSGRIAFLVSIPVAMHCLYALGFQAFDARVLVHSLLGCFFYGVFVVKMLVLRRDDAPGWVLPVVGGVTFTALVGLWLSAALWFFTTKGLIF